MSDFRTGMSGACMSVKYLRAGIKPKHVYVDPMDGGGYARYVPERTCKDASTDCDIWQCSECGIQFENPVYFPTLWDGSKVAAPRFCPGCGAKCIGGDA